MVAFQFKFSKILYMRYLFILLLNTLSLSAQKMASISGTITDMQNGEHLVGVVIYDSISKKATTTNYYGFYSISLPQGKVKLRYSTIGYQYVGSNINLTKDTFVNIAMKPAVIEIKEVTI